jgi:hypothetical protein
MRPDAEVLKLFEDYVAFDGPNLRILDEEHVRNVLTRELVQHVLEISDPSDSRRIGRQIALTLRDLCCLCVLPVKAPPSLEPLQAIDLAQASDAEAFDFLKSCNKLGVCQPALVDSRSEDLTIIFAVRAFALTLRSGLRGPLFLGRPQLGALEEELGIKNTLEQARIVNGLDPQELIKAGWLRSTVLQQTAPAADFLLRRS